VNPPMSEWARQATVTVIDPPRDATPAENQHLADALRGMVTLDPEPSQEFVDRFLSGTIRAGVVYDLDAVVRFSHQERSGQRRNLNDAQMDRRDALIERYFGLVWPRASRLQETIPGS
jgi:hypothetical protein